MKNNQPPAGMPEPQLVIMNKQTEISRLILLTQEEERRRISESLHNGLGQILYSIKISLSHLSLQAAVDDPETYLANKRYTDDLLTKAIRESRRISHELMPAMLEDFGLKAAIEDVCQQLSDDVKLKCYVTDFDKRVDKYTELAVFRIIQELLTNIIKHARATTATIHVELNDCHISIRVKDNGIGMGAGTQHRPGIGLATIRSKVRLLNGDLEIDTAEGKGTSFIISIPVHTPD